MGCSPLFCCFRNYRPNCIALTAIVTNIIAVAFMIWALVDLEWGWTRKGRKALYIIAFVILCVTLALLIAVLVILNLRVGANYITCNNIGRIFCLIIVILAILAFIFLLIDEILLIVDYAKIESDLGKGRNIPSHDWAACILPGIIGLIASVIIALCANILYRIFYDNILGTFLDYQNNGPMQHVNNNSISTIPNVTQAPVAVTVNNPPIVTPPIIPNVEPVQPQIPNIIPNLNIKAPFQEPYPANFHSLTNLNQK